MERKKERSTFGLRLTSFQFIMFWTPNHCKQTEQTLRLKHMLCYCCMWLISAFTAEMLWSPTTKTHSETQLFTWTHKVKCKFFGPRMSACHQDRWVKSVTVQKQGAAGFSVSLSNQTLSENILTGRPASICIDFPNVVSVEPLLMELLPASLC